MAALGGGGRRGGGPDPRGSSRSGVREGLLAEPEDRPQARNFRSRRKRPLSFPLPRGAKEESR